MLTNCIKSALYRLNLESLDSEFVALCEHDVFLHDVTDNDATFETGISAIKNRQIVTAG